MRRIASGPSGTRSRPCHNTSPATMRPGGIAISLSTVIAVTVLPQPDSPTTATVSPWSTVRSTPSTACNQPSSVAKWVFNPRISSRCAVIANLGDAAERNLGVSRTEIPRLRLGMTKRRLGMTKRRLEMTKRRLEMTKCRLGMTRPATRSASLHHLARIECIAQAITGEVDAEHREEDRRAGEQREVRRNVEIVLGVEENAAPRWNVGRKTQAEKRQRRLGDDRRGNVDRAGNDHRPERIRQDVAHDLARQRCAKRTRCLDELFFAQRKKLRPHQARNRHPPKQP